MRWREPMLATLTDERFSDPEWIFERKLDGERCLAFRSSKRVTLRSRNRESLNRSYPELVDALGRQRASSFVLDGEIVAFEGTRTSFSRLQGRIGIDDPDQARDSEIAVYLYLFDVLELDGRDTRGLQQRRRKSTLRDALAFEDPLRYTPHRLEHGERLWSEACEKGWEGLIAKDGSARYSGGRSRSWLKFKCTRGQELVIVGYTDPGGSRRGFGALLVGYNENGELRYAGKVGTGFDQETLECLGGRLRRLERETPPIAGDPRIGAPHWVRPELVGEFGFTEWTRNGRLRHPRFLGLRRDKDPADVVRERPG